MNVRIFMCMLRLSTFEEWKFLLQSERRFTLFTYQYKTNTIKFSRLPISCRAIPKSGMFWSTLELLSSYLPEIGLTGVYAVAILTLVGLCSDRLRQKRKEKEEYDGKDQVGRRLGIFESAIDDLHSYGGSVRTIVLLLKSRVSLQASEVREVLERLPNKHPILRMRVKEIDVNRRGKPLKCFIEMEEPCTLDFYVKSHKPARNWESTFEKELLSPFEASTGPLWRVRMLREEYESREGWYTNTVLFTVHQVIADDTSLLKLCEDFLDFLNTKHNNNSSQNWDEKILSNILPLRPALTELLKSHITLSQLDKMLLAFKPIFNRLLKRIVGKPRHQFTGVFPPISLQDPSTVKKTCILSRNLPKEAISRLAKNCKENKCTVHGAFIAATSIAMATMLQNGKIRMPMTIPLSFNVNIRQECNPPLTSDELGCYSLDCEFKIPVPVRDETQEGFWNFAKKCTENLCQVVAKGKHHSILKSLNTLDIDFARKMYKVSKNKKTAGRLDSLVNISNLGRHKFGSEVERKVYECSGVYFAAAGHNFGPVFGNNIVTINGNLLWSIVYYSNVVSQEVACQFADLVFETLKEHS